MTTKSKYDEIPVVDEQLAGTDFKENYLLSPNHCPFCESDNITAGGNDYQDNIILVSVSCKACGQQWIDVYRLVDIQPE